MTQVDERQSTRESEHDVCGFQVAVDDALFLHVAQRKQQRADARARGARGHALPRRAAHVPEQLASGKQVEHEVEVALVL